MQKSKLEPSADSMATQLSLLPPRRGLSTGPGTVPRSVGRFVEVVFPPATINRPDGNR